MTTAEPELGEGITATTVEGELGEVVVTSPQLETGEEITATTAMPDLQAYSDSISWKLPVLVGELRRMIGPRLVAYCTGVTETRAVHEWAEGSRTPQPATAAQLRFLYRVVAMLSDRTSPAVAQAWLQGMSPRLNDRAPARLIREGELSEVGPEVLDAARSFVAGA